MSSRLQLQWPVRRPAYFGVIHSHNGIGSRICAYRQLPWQLTQLHQDRPAGSFINLEILCSIVIAFLADMHGIRSRTHQCAVAKRQLEPTTLHRQAVRVAGLDVEMDRLRGKQERRNQCQDHDRRTDIDLPPIAALFDFNR